MLESGDLSKLRYRNPCPRTHHASKMVIFLLNSTSVILLIRGKMQSTLASGCNTTHSVNFNPHYLRWTLTLFDRQILPRIMPLGTNYFHLVNGLIWYIMIHSSMALLTLLLSTAGKLEIVSPNQIVTSSKPIVTCSTTHFRALMCHHIPFTLTADHMSHFTVTWSLVNW